MLWGGALGYFNASPPSAYFVLYLTLTQALVLFVNALPVLTIFCPRLFLSEEWSDESKSTSKCAILELFPASE